MSTTNISGVTAIVPPATALRLRRQLSSYMDYAGDWKDEMIASTEILFSSKFNWLLALGPLAVLGDATHTLGKSMCFVFTGVALIPCAERLSFITEQVAEHTNGTTGALLNATFGNAPELLISVAALRAGYYRVVQLAMLGSMLTNMMFVFGLSCVIGGLRWQVQELRTPSGNVNIVMLLVGTAGSLFPAALKLTGQLSRGSTSQEGEKDSTEGSSSVTQEEITFCRVNAFIMLFLYVCFLGFQLSTHKEEFDEDPEGFHAKRPRRNLVCLSLFHRVRRRLFPNGTNSDATATMRTHQMSTRSMNIGEDEEMLLFDDDADAAAASEDDDDSANWGTPEEGIHSSSTASLPLLTSMQNNLSSTASLPLVTSMQKRKRRRRAPAAALSVEMSSVQSLTSSNNSNSQQGAKNKSKNSDHAELDQKEASELLLKESSANPTRELGGGAIMDDDEDASDADEDNLPARLHPDHDHPKEGPLISMRVGIAWLLIITICVSAISDVLVDTIDDFSHRMHLSGVFTSMVIIPFFSNVAEQVSAFLFAYRNEMDLCVGVTVGSAIQIATFVLPGSVIIGYLMDRPMTLYFHGYETCCLFFCVLVLGSVLQGGTTNWMTGAMLVGIYIMMASGIWFHEMEELTD